MPDYFVSYEFITNLQITYFKFNYAALSNQNLTNIKNIFWGIPLSTDW